MYDFASEYFSGSVCVYPGEHLCVLLFRVCLVCVCVCVSVCQYNDTVTEWVMMLAASWEHYTVTI